MNLLYGNGTTENGPGINIELDGNEIAEAIQAWISSKGLTVQGPRTIHVNGQLCENGRVYVDPSGTVTSDAGFTMSGRGFSDGYKAADNLIENLSNADSLHKPDASDFISELRQLINKHNMEHRSDTPDFILAQYLTSCLQAWNMANEKREAWYGRKL